MGTRKPSLILAALGIIVGLGLLVACDGGNSTQMGSVTTVLSDPTTCGPPNGIFSHVYVTVTDVKIHQSANAGPNDADWRDLTPGIAPQTIDLLGSPNNQCFLAQLSNGAVNLQAGSYQQIRIFLASSGDNSFCGSGNGPNCVVSALGTSRLQLSSEAQQGVKIPSGQIAGGQFTIAAGQSKDLDVHFDACASIVIQGNNQYRLKPVLLAGEVSLTPAPISGVLMDTTFTTTLTGLTAIATLQQPDASGIDRIKQQVSVDPATGQFRFCPLLVSGASDLVVVAYDSQHAKSYAVTVIKGVASGSNNKVPMSPVTTTSSTNNDLSSILGEVDTTPSGVSVPVKLSALEDAGSGLFVTVPVVTAPTSEPTVNTAANTCKTANAFCVPFTLQVPGAPPNVGTAGSTTFTQTASDNYKVSGEATTCAGATTPPQVVASDIVKPPPAGSATLPNVMNFSNCSGL